MLAYEKLTSPKGIERPSDDQQLLDEATQHMALYQFKTCPFCIKVRQEIRRQSLNIELRDAQYDTNYRQELEEGGGHVKVPCLQVRNDPDGIIWLYESDTIIDYLRKIAA